MNDNVDNFIDMMNSNKTLREVYLRNRGFIFVLIDFELILG